MVAVSASPIGERVDLARRRPDEAHRREPLVAPRGGQARGRGHEHSHRRQRAHQRDREQQLEEQGRSRADARLVVERGGDAGAVGAEQVRWLAHDDRELVGRGEAGDPIVPTTRPNRFPSWSGGVASISRPSAGDTNASPGPGTRRGPAAPAPSRRGRRRPCAPAARRSKRASVRDRIRPRVAVAISRPGVVGVKRHATWAWRTSRAGVRARPKSRIAVPTLTARAVNPADASATRPPVSVRRIPSRITRRCRSGGRRARRSGDRHRRRRAARGSPRPRSCPVPGRVGQQLHHLLAGQRVERAGRLVGEHDARARRPARGRCATRCA